MSTVSDEDVRDQVRAHYAAAATAVRGGCCASCASPADDAAGTSAAEQACCAPDGAPNGALVEAGFGAGMYTAAEQDELPAEALAASLGCGNPLAVAELRPGERVLDLGSGGGIDVLLSARRVGPTGFAYGIDMPDEMLELARANAAKSGVRNVEFVKGAIEDLPLPDAAVDVVISNCVINLSTDKPAVLAEMFRVLAPGGRVGISDMVADDGLSRAERAERGGWAGCIAGALSRQEYLDGLAAAGFVEASVELTHEAVPGIHAAIVRAVKPAA
jgi:arsenite methyltransferase